MITTVRHPAGQWRSAMARAFAGMLAIGIVHAPAAGAAEAALSARDRTDIARVEAYLNGLGSVRAGFIQTASTGSFAEGRLYIKRPGKLRLDYAPPTKLQVYADGIWLIYVDGELDQLNHVPLKATPARVLVDETIALSGDLRVARVERGAQALRVHIQQTDEPDAGTLILTFGDRPLVLRQWTVVDAQGVRTRVALVNPEFNVPIDNGVFVVDAPVGPPDRDE